MMRRMMSTMIRNLCKMKSQDKPCMIRLNTSNSHTKLSTGVAMLAKTICCKTRFKENH